jgi:hypothetical protein
VTCIPSEKEPNSWMTRPYIQNIIPKVACLLSYSIHPCSLFRSCNFWKMTTQWPLCFLLLPGTFIPYLSHDCYPTVFSFLCQWA